MLRLRIASAVVLVPLLFGVFLAGQPWLSILVGGIVLLAARETFDLLRRAGLAVEPLLGVPLAVLAVLEAYLNRPVFALAVVVAALVLPAFAAFRRTDPRQGFQAWLATSFGILYVALFAFVVRILQEAPTLPAATPLASALDGGRVWLLVLVLGVWSFDTAAYAAGRTIGRGRFLNHISPSKTWSGVIGGTLGAVVVTGVLVVGAGGSLVAGLVLGLLLSAAAQAGDVAESMLKRAAGTKDSGALIPGHGGMLDRIDSLLFAAPVVYLFLATGAAG